MILASTARFFRFLVEAIPTLGLVLGRVMAQHQNLDGLAGIAAAKSKINKGPKGPKLTPTPTCIRFASLQGWGFDNFLVCCRTQLTVGNFLSEGRHFTAQRRYQQKSAAVLTQYPKSMASLKIKKKLLLLYSAKC